MGTGNPLEWQHNAHTPRQGAIEHPLTIPSFTLHWMSAALLLALSPGGAVAEVNVRLTETTFSQDKPLQVSFEASGASVASPDLSPLQTDFEILNRSLQQRSSTVNGRRTQWSSLSLLLRAKRVGKLEIPALRFGDESSRPLSVTVLASTEPLPSAPPQSQAAPVRDQSSPWNPFGIQPPPFGTPLGAGMDSPFAPLGGNPSAPFHQLPGAPNMGEKGPPASSPPVRGVPPQLESVNAPLEDRDRFWSWVAGFTVAGWLGTLVLCWRRERKWQSSGMPPPNLVQPVPQAPPVEEETAVSRAVRQIASAYQRGDAGAARQALLAWGRLTWALDPPGNLSRLAERVTEPLRGYVLELDEALYSPTPVPWDQRPLPDLLTRLAQR